MCVFLFGNDGIPGAGKQSAKDARPPDDISEREKVGKGHFASRASLISSLSVSQSDAEKMSGAAAAAAA